MEVKPGYKQTDFGVIPEDWELMPLRSVSTMNGRIGWQGFTQAEFSSNEDDPFLITGMNFKDGEIRWDEVYHVSEARYEMAKPIQLQSGDVLMTKDGTIGKMLYVDQIPYPGKASLNSHLLVFRPLQGKYHPKFMFYQLCSEIFRRHIDLEKSGSTFFGITQVAVGKYFAILPPIKEQAAIAQALTDTGALIASLDALISKKRLIKQGVMQELLHPQKDDQIYLLKDVSTLKGRIGWQGLTQSEFTENGNDPYLITGMNFKDGTIRWNEVYHIPYQRYELAKDIQLQRGDVLMTKDGTIGKLLYVDEIPFPGIASINSHLLLFRPVRNLYHPKYLYYQLNSKNFAEFVELNKSGTTFFGISQASVGNYPVHLPPIEVQKNIAGILSDMDSEITGMEGKLKKSRQIKQGMMQELLTGRIRLV